MQTNHSPNIFIIKRANNSYLYFALLKQVKIIYISCYFRSVFRRTSLNLVYNGLGQRKVTKILGN